MHLQGPDAVFFRRSLGWALAIRFVVLFIAIIAASEIARGRPLDSTLPETFTHWDAVHYLRIAEVGYRNYGEDRFLVNFFPLYPLLIWLLQFLVGNYLAAALLISFAGSVAAGFLLSKLAALDFGAPAARYSLLFFFLSPTAYFLAVPYTEALFAALALSSFYFARKKNWAASAFSGLLATAARWPGIMLFPALVLEAWVQEGKDIRRAWWLLLVPLGFISYLAINFFVTGSPFSFVPINEEHWYHKPVAPWDSLWTAANEYAKNPFNFGTANEHMLRVYSFVFSAALLFAGRKKLRPSYQLFAWGSLLMLLSVTWQIGLPRYLLSIFPLFLVMGDFGARHRKLSAVLLLASFSLFVYLAHLFLKGWYAF